MPAQPEKLYLLSAPKILVQRPRGANPTLSLKSPQNFLVPRLHLLLSPAPPVHPSSPTSRPPCHHPARRLQRHLRRSAGGSPERGGKKTARMLFSRMLSLRASSRLSPSASAAAGELDPGHHDAEVRDGHRHPRRQRRRMRARSTSPPPGVRLRRCYSWPTGAHLQMRAWYGPFHQPPV